MRKSVARQGVFACKGGSDYNESVFYHAGQGPHGENYEYQSLRPRKGHREKFQMEVINKGTDYDTEILTITDVNRPGLQFIGFRLF